jgi:1,4-alpha-glucan branching enzyme
MLPQHRRLRAVTAGEHIDAYTSTRALRLADGSWGQNGDYSMWMNEQVQWTWPVVWDVEHAFWGVAREALVRTDLHDLLGQAARAMLLLQSSDWQFIMSTGDVRDYAIKRFNGHAEDAQTLIAAMRRALRGELVGAAHETAGQQFKRDDLFREIIPSIEIALRTEPVRVVTDPVMVRDEWDAGVERGSSEG